MDTHIRRNWVRIEIERTLTSSVGHPFIHNIWIKQTNYIKIFLAIFRRRDRCCESEKKNNRIQNRQKKYSQNNKRLSSN